MKRFTIIAIAFILGVCATHAMGQEYSVLVKPGQVKVQAAEGTPMITVMPPGRVYVAPQVVVPRHVPPAIPPKPVFRTPVRNGMWGIGVHANRALWYNRYYRYQRLGGLLGPTVIVQPYNPYQQ